MVDTSHMNVKSFWDVGEAGIPLVATHSNAYALCQTTRNLTDEQLRAIGETQGMAGLNFGTIFIESDAWRGGTATLDKAVAHMAHMIEQAGEDAVGLGTDFDGAPLPEGMRSAADLPKLVEAMRAAEFGDELIAKITHENWLAFLNRHFRGS